MPSFRPEHLVVVSLYAEDVPALANFYHDVVGLPMLAHHHHPPAFDLGRGLALAIVEGQLAHPREPRRSRFPVLAFSVKDLAEAIDQLKRHDVDLPWGLEAGATERWVKFYDPAGNLIEFAQFKRPAHS